MLKHQFFRTTTFAFSLALALTFQACTPSKDVKETEKIIKVAMGDDPKTLDPAQSSDQGSSGVIGNIFEGLLRFSYLGPAGQVEPSLARTLPVVKDGGKTYIFHIRKEVLFQDDPAFPEGKGREVTAHDFVYSFKRIADPNPTSPNWWMFEGMIVGLNEWREKLKNASPEERQGIWDSSIEGLAATDRHTLQLQLTRAYPQLLQILSMTHASVVAREVVNKYSEDVGNHPIGTGAYYLKDWIRGSKVVLARNPTFREDTYPTVGTDEERKDGLLKAAGEKIPFADQLHFSIFKEEQPRWLNFLTGNLDITGIPKDNFSDTIGASGDLKEEMRIKGFRLKKRLSLTSWWIEFNLKDEFLGKHKKVRQAMWHAFDRKRALELLFNNRGQIAGGPITPTLEGGSPIESNPYPYDLEKAKALLKEAGFEGGKGIPEFTFDLRGAGATNRQLGEFLKDSFAQIGIELKIRGNTFSQALQIMKEAKFQIMLGGWAADYPDPENFLQLYYSPNKAPGPNSANFANSEYDKLYEQIRTERPGPSRSKAIAKMNKILQDEAAAIFFFHSMAYTVYRSWLKNFAPHEFLYGTERFWDIDQEEKQKLLN
ncbi:hypothetical protein GW916_02215 [bacterium]|nr:hypothetical protein [bacterium]